MEQEIYVDYWINWERDLLMTTYYGKILGKLLSLLYRNYTTSSKQ